jgi:hypothetical protein
LELEHSLLAVALAGGSTPLFLKKIAGRAGLYRMMWALLPFFFLYFFYSVLVLVHACMPLASYINHFGASQRLSERGVVVARALNLMHAHTTTQVQVII